MAGTYAAARTRSSHPVSGETCGGRGRPSGSEKRAVAGGVEAAAAGPSPPAPTYTEGVEPRRRPRQGDAAEDRHGAEPGGIRRSPPQLSQCCSDPRRGRRPSRPHEGGRVWHIGRPLRNLPRPEGAGAGAGGRQGRPGSPAPLPPRHRSPHGSTSPSPSPAGPWGRPQAGPPPHPPPPPRLALPGQIQGGLQAAVGDPGHDIQQDVLKWEPRRNEVGSPCGSRSRAETPEPLHRARSGKRRPPVPWHRVALLGAPLAPFRRAGPPAAHSPPRGRGGAPGRTAGRG